MTHASPSTRLRGARQKLAVTLVRGNATASLAQGVRTAVERGVSVVVLLPQGPGLNLLWYARLDEWMSAGVRVFQSRQHDRLAAVVCVADEQWASVVYRRGVDPFGRTVDANAEVVVRDAEAVRWLGNYFDARCAAAAAFNAPAQPASLGWLRWARQMSMPR